MTLRVLGTLRWEPEGAPPRPLPVVLPAAILLVLARHVQWVSRTQLASLFWPGMPLEAERRRVRWLVQTDLDPADRAAGPLATGFDLPEFEPFQAWLHEWRQACSGPALSAAPAAEDEAPAAPASGPGFYGRRVELAQLRAGDAPVSVVLGEAGLGKSRLVAEAVGASPWLHCRAGLRAMPFAAVAELFERHPGLGAYRLDVPRLLPDIAPDEPLPPLDAVTARVRLFEGLARTIE